MTTQPDSARRGGLFQRPPQTPEELAASAPLAIPPDEVAEMDEDTWYAQAYRGDDVPQLTLRAVLMGSMLGFFLAFTNLYVGLKTGWHLGVAITACILSFTIWNGLKKLGAVNSPMTILENNCMQSTASAAGYSTGSALVSAFPALLMMSATAENPRGAHLSVLVVATFVVFSAILGVTLAIPMKRNLINHDRLKFPSGLAAAVTLQSLYAAGGEAVKKGKALLFSASVGGLVPLLIDLNAKQGANGREPLLPAHSNIFDWLPAAGSHVVDGKAVPYKPSDWTMTLDHNPVMIAAGAIVGLRVALWMLIAGLLLAFVVGPYGLEAVWTSPAGVELAATTKPAKAWKEIGLWLGAPMMVSSGLLAFAFQWRTILRAFSGLRGGGGGTSDEKARVEVPLSWFLVGATVAGIGLVFLVHVAFDVPVLLGVLAVLLTFVLSLVAARSTGESDITPTGAMGKIMQLTYGVLIPQSVTANLMTAAVTSSSASASADLLNDLKSGYLLGANPRRQFIAQAMGIISGTVATVLGYFILVPDATALLGGEGKAPAFPAPAAQAWKAVAEVFRLGIGNMHPTHQKAILVGLALGAVVVMLEHVLPKAKKWLPSATGLGLGFILPFQYPLAMCIGAVIAAVWMKRAPQSGKDLIVPISSGIIAGVSIVGVIVAAINNFVLS
jgi:uncharacterized oligopeptide transporter (OPT) family protein